MEGAINNIVIPETSDKNIVSALSEIKKTLSGLPKQFPKPKDVVIPEQKDFPTSFSLRESNQILSALSEIKKELGRLPRQFPKQEATKIDLKPLTKEIKAVQKAVDSIKFPDVEIPSSVEISNFPPQRIPKPATSININSLRGPVLATQVTVAATATATPTTSISQRRSLIIYNNSSQTVYLGDENVNTNDGFPVPASQYSPPMDLGDNVELYAIVSSGTADVRIFEASMDGQGA